MKKAVVVAENHFTFSYFYKYCNQIFLYVMENLKIKYVVNLCELL